MTMHIRSASASPTSYLGAAHMGHEAHKGHGVHMGHGAHKAHGHHGGGKSDSTTDDPTNPLSPDYDPTLDPNSPLFGGASASQTSGILGTDQLQLSR